VAIQDAVAARGHPVRPVGDDAPACADTTSLLQEIEAVSRALRHPDAIETVRARATAATENVPAHE
jgi:hypothetical protein